MGLVPESNKWLIDWLSDCKHTCLLAGMRSSGGDGVCRSFVHLSHMVSLSAQTLRKVGDGYQADECRRACLDSTDFVCVAAQMQLPATCFITGFRLRSDYISRHYTRVCRHGQFTDWDRLHGVQCSFTTLNHDYYWSHWWLMVVATSLVTSTKLLYVEPGLYRDGWLFAGTPSWYSTKPHRPT